MILPAYHRLPPGSRAAFLLMYIQPISRPPGVEIPSMDGEEGEYDGKSRNHRIDALYPNLPIGTGNYARPGFENRTL
jgi:hypothetical protein